VRLLVRYILFLLGATAAHAQSSVWWYPYGPAEATRYQTAPTTGDSVPVVRWRTAALRSSPVVLVGALRGEPGGAQQIVGQTGDRIVILRSEGWLDTSATDVSLALPEEASIRLTGLFNTTAPTPTAAGVPNAIGIGVTRVQQIRDPYGLLLRPDFGLLQELAILRLNSQRTENLTVTVAPIAAYTPPGESAPIAVALVSQDRFVPFGSDTMVNGVRRYRLNPSTPTVVPDWRYVVAPRTLDHPSSLTVDTAGGEGLLAMSTSAYTFAQPMIAAQLIPNRGAVETNSNRAYAWLSDVRSPVLQQEIEIPPVPPSVVVPGIVPAQANSYFVRLTTGTPAREQPYRLITEEHDAARPGRPRLLLRLYNAGLNPDQQAAPIFTDTTVSGLGWSIVQADLDGLDNSIGPIRPSPGREIVVVRRRLDGAPLDSNRFFVFRGLLALHADQAIRGTLLAAGDLVLDPLEKDEIVIADGNTVSILRFRDYDDRNLQLEVRNYFDTLGTYTLDARVLAAAIADVDADGANDLVVSTEAATWVLGRPHPAPLGVVAIDRTEICASEPVVIRWQRAVGGGEGGMRIELLRVDSLDTTLVEDIPSSADQSYTLSDVALAPGRYRLRVSDRDVPTISAESREFTVLPATIESFAVASAGVGEPVTIATRVRCIDSLQLEYLFPGSGWTRVPGRVVVRDGAAEVSLPMPCPADLQCGSLEDRVIQFRFVTTDGTVVSQPASTTVRFPTRQVVTAPITGAGSRRRELRWSELEYSCDSVRIALSTDDGSTWSDVETVARTAERFELDVPGELSQEVLARVCCDVGCGTGLARFVVEEIGEADFVAPNPFDPTDASESGATIIYRLNAPGTVSVAVYDVSRAITRRLVDADELRSGLHRLTWDGRNDAGEIVADGAYICLITSTGGDRIALPLSIVKR